MLSLEEKLAEKYLEAIKTVNAEKVLADISIELEENSGSFEKFVNYFNNDKPEGAVALSTLGWFKVVGSKPDDNRFNVQVGVHIEECAELLKEFSTENEELDAKMLLAMTLLNEVSSELKSGKVKVKILNVPKFYDAILDQRVTGTGVAVLGKFNLSEGVARVDVANFTKFVDGVPQYKEGGKVAKGLYFVEPEIPYPGE